MKYFLLYIYIYISCLTCISVASKIFIAIGIFVSICEASSAVASGKTAFSCCCFRTGGGPLVNSSQENFRKKLKHMHNELLLKNGPPCTKSLVFLFTFALFVS